MSELKLKNCPFCGGRASQPASTSPSDERCGYNFVAYVECSACGVSTRTESNHDKGGWCNESIESAKARAVKKWNSRTQPEATAPAQDLGAAIPDGWQLVPIEPTPEMLDKAGHDLYWQAESCEYPQTVLEFQADAHTAWRAMLLASPACAMTKTRIVMLLREARATLEMWKDVAPAVSLCADIDAALASPADALVAGDRVDAERWRFRQKFLMDGGAVLWSQRGCQYRNAQGAIICQGGTEEEAIDAAIQAQKDGHG